MAVTVRTTHSIVPVRERGRAWIVIPTYNEVDNLAPLVTAVRAAIDGSILIVDDNSPDGTGAIADRLAATHRGVHVLHRPAKAGLAAAYTAAISTSPSA